MAEETTHSSSKRERPLSPHLTIYKPQITSFTSIMHRASGVFLLIGAFVFAYWLYEIANPNGCQCMVWVFNTIVGKLALFAWTLAINYHLFNGLRHLSWDFGLGFEIATATRTGWVAIIAALISTGLIWAAVLI